MPAAKRGQPTAYRTEFVAKAKKLAELGASDFEMADIFGVSVRTLHRWKHAHPEFCHSLKMGKEVPDERVKRSLFQRAVGYTFASEKVFQNAGKIVRAKTIEHCPPDPTSCIFWLKNRLPDEFRDKQEVEHSLAVTLAMMFKASGMHPDGQSDEAVKPQVAH
jgi:hypothetical protein